MSDEQNNEAPPEAMPFDLENVPEEHAVDAGEVRLQLARVQTGEGKKGTYIRLGLNVENDPDAKEISDFLSFPNKEDDPKTVNSKRRRLLNTLIAFSIPVPSGTLTPQSIADHMSQYIGQVAWAFVSAKDDGKGYGMQNSVKSYSKAG